MKKNVTIYCIVGLIIQIILIVIMNFLASNMVRANVQSDYQLLGRASYYFNLYPLFYFFPILFLILIIYFYKKNKSLENILGLELLVNGLIIIIPLFIFFIKLINAGLWTL